jgi:hypothetical protein
VGVFTTNVPDAAFPVPPSVEVTTLVVLILEPLVTPVTGTLKVQAPFAASEPPVKEIEPGAVVVSVPPQVGVGPLAATATPDGNGSVKLMPLSEFS